MQIFYLVFSWRSYLDLFFFSLYCVAGVIEPGIEPCTGSADPQEIARTIF